MADNDLSGKVGLDTTGFRTGVSQLTSQIKNIETGFRASAAVMGSWSTTSEGLVSRTSSLSEKLSLQKQALNILHTEFDKVVASEGADSKAAESLASQMFSMEGKITSTEKSLSKYDSQLKTVESQEKGNTSSLSKFKTGFMNLAEQSKKSTSAIKDHFSSLKSTITGAIGGIIAGMSLKEIISDTDAADKNLAQMSAVLKSTGGAVGMTKEQLVGLAEAQSKVTTYSAETTEKAENMLLTFTKIGKDTFPSALRATENMATAMHTDATSAALQLGKALNDPAKGYSKLQRAGVTFTDAQVKTIKAMEKSGNTAGAQKVILQELDKEYGNSAKAAGSTLPGQIQIMQNSIKSSGVQIMGAMLPIVQNLMPSIVKGVQGIASFVMSHKAQIVGAVQGVATTVKNIFGWVESHGPLVKSALIGIATAVGVWKMAMLAANTVSTVHNALTALGIIKSGAAATAKGVETAATVANNTATSGGTIAIIAHNAALVASKVAMAAATAAQWLFNAALNANPIGIVITLIAGLVAAMVVLFNNNKGFHDWVVNAWNTIKNLAGTVGNGIKDAFVGAWNGIKSAWSAVTGFFSGIWDKIVSTFKPDLITNAFKSAWDGIKGAWNGAAGWFGNVWNSIKGHFKPDMISNGFKSAWSGVQGAWHGAGEWFGGIWQSIKDGFSKLNPIQWGKDLIDGIASGIRSAADHVKTAVGNVAQNIRSFLHFSVPDEGPLTDYQSWMPDFMGGLAESIAKSKYKVSQAIQGLSTDMSIGVKAQMQPAYAGAYAPQPATVQNNVSLPKYLYATINLPGGKAWEAIVPIVGSSLNKNATDSKMGRT